MKIYADLISNVTTRINLRTCDPALPPTLRSPIGGSLIYFYALLALVKGRDTSPQDAHHAWLMWLASQRGEPVSETTITELGFHAARIAEAIADSARYPCSQPAKE